MSDALLVSLITGILLLGLVTLLALVALLLLAAVRLAARCARALTGLRRTAAEDVYELELEPEFGWFQRGGVR